MAGFGYNSENDVPVADAPFYLTPEYWNKTSYKVSYHDHFFRELIGPERSGNMIIHKADELNKGGKQSTIAMRLNADPGTKPVKGAGQIIKYSDINGSSVQDMSWAKMQVYAGRERFGWLLKSVEDERMVRYLGVVNESATWVGELFKQRDEESIIHAMLFGLSQSVTRTQGAASADGTPTYVGHIQKMPPSFKRLVSSGCGITHMPHPNTYFLDEAVIDDLVAAKAANNADIAFDTVLDSMIAETAAGECVFTLAAITRANRLARFNKIKPVMTPFGARWLWFVPPAAGRDIRILLQAVNQAAGPRDYGMNRLWGGVLKDYDGFLFIETEYLTSFANMITQEDLVDATYGYDVDAEGTNATMKLSITDANNTVFPTLICGQEALAFAQPESMNNAEEWLDGRNKYFKIGARTFGYRRADWFKDNDINYFGGTSVARSIVSASSGAFSTAHKVWNWSSMLVFAKTAEPIM